MRQVTKYRSLFLRLWIGALFAVPLLSSVGGEIGQDVAAVFQRAKKGAPLRYVALGGSITQGGEGWIGPWLQDQFPESQVISVNSGMSGTGSGLGIFRVGRDVIAHQPDLVAIEYCVNDGGAGDEDVIRNMESLIVRLRNLPHPPAIIVLEAAAKGGVNLKRHRKVARHYDLVEVDLQAAVDTELEATGAEWSTLFSDDVHPVGSGHALYAKAIAATLEPYRDVTGAAFPGELPEPLSAKPLVLDGRMVSLSGYGHVEGWGTKNSLPHWWDRFFHGVLHSETPGAALEIPFRGTRVGVYVAMDRSYGSFFTSVDGDAPEHMFTNTRGGYQYKTLAQDLEPQEHLLTIVLPTESDSKTGMNGPVNLGYLLLAGESRASTERAQQGPIKSRIMADLKFEAVDLSAWEWAGPFTLPTKAKDALPLLNVVFTPEVNPDAVEWQSDERARTVFEFDELFETGEPAVAYVRGTLDRDVDESVLLGVQVDYFAKIWLNGEFVSEIDSGHGHSEDFVYVPLSLQSGTNLVEIKVAAGSAGHALSLAMAQLHEARDAFMSDGEQEAADTTARP